MKQRLIASGIVFGVGFVVGLGATYTLLGRTPTTPQVSPGPSTPIAALTESDTAITSTADSTDPRPRHSNESPVPTKNTPIPAQAPKESGAHTVKPPSETDEIAPTVASVDAESNPTMPPSDETAETLPAAEKPEEAEPEENKWWEGLAGSICEIDLGRARALTIRKGKVKDGQVTDWSAAFGSNPRIGLLSALEKNIVTVHGVAVDEQGIPIAAEVSLDKQGKITRGVIALHTQGLRVSLKRVDTGKSQ